MEACLDTSPSSRLSRDCPGATKGQAEASGDGQQPLSVSCDTGQLQALKARAGLRHKSHDVHDPRMIRKQQQQFYGQPINAASAPNLHVPSPLPSTPIFTAAPTLVAISQVLNAWMRQLMDDWGMGTGSCVHTFGGVGGGVLKLHMEISICGRLAEEEAEAGNNCHSPQRLWAQACARGLTQVNH